MALTEPKRWAYYTARKQGKTPREILSDFQTKRHNDALDERIWREGLDFDVDRRGNYSATIQRQYGVRVVVTVQTDEYYDPTMLAGDDETDEDLQNKGCDFIAVILVMPDGEERTLAAVGRDYDTRLMPQEIWRILYDVIFEFLDFYEPEIQGAEREAGERIARYV